MSAPARTTRHQVLIGHQESAAADGIAAVATPASAMPGPDGERRRIASPNPTLVTLIGVTIAAYPASVPATAASHVSPAICGAVFNRRCV